MTAPGVIILRPSDSESLAALDLAATGRISPAASWEATLSQPSMLALGIEAEAGGLIAAILVSMTPDGADIIDIDVHPDHRRKGLATALITAALRRAGERGIARMLLDVAEGNHGARALYGALGFAEDGRRRKYYGGVEDAILMSRRVA